MNYWGSAAFLSAGGYHHHIGINTWESLTGSPFNNGYIGLEYFTIHLSNKNAATQLYSSLKVTSERSVFIYDPDGIKILPSASQT
jgi:catechol 2,3-dioxygenase